MANTNRGSVSDRRARVEKVQREQQTRERRRLLIVLCAVVVIIAALVAGVVIGKRKADTAPVLGKQIVPAAVTGPSTPCPTTGKFDSSACTTLERKPTEVPNRSGIDGVVAYDTEGWPGDGKPHPGALDHDHVNGPVKYTLQPPVGGAHNPVWMNAGVYTEPVPTERAVHNVEHGAIWITYRPNLAAKQVDKLRAFVGNQSMIDEIGDNGNANRFMDLSPWKDNSLTSPIVLTAWGYQLRITSPDDPRMQKFVDTFRHNKTYSPEYGSPVDGVPVQTGGQPALYGSKFANPNGSVQGQ